MRRICGIVVCLVATLGAGAGLAASAWATSGVMAWGQNEWGQLGTGNTKASDVPVTLAAPTEVAAVSGGGQYSVVLLSNGTVKTSGINFAGQLGDGTYAESRVFVEVSGLSEVTAISAGGEHVLALLKNGHVMAWGGGGDGELGNGTYSGSDKPVEVKGLSEVVAVAAGNRYSLALLSNGKVMAWGNNELGELGDGTTTGTDEPVEVSGLSGVTAIAASGPALALLENGTVKAWGDNEDGELGDGSETGPEKCTVVELVEKKEKLVPVESEAPCSRTPVTVSGLSEVTAISSGAEHGLALLKGGGLVKAWGDNQQGELGDGSEAGPEKCPYEIQGEVREVPCSRTPVTSGVSGVTAISAGWFDNLALLSGGTVKAWGESGEGQLGNGTRGGPEKCKSFVSFGGEGYFEITSGCARTPVETQELSGSVAGISAGGEQSLAYGPVGPLVTGVTPGVGPTTGGTHISITGSHFTGATKVEVGTTSVSFKVESDTLITAETPAGSVGLVHVRVTTPSGTIEPSAANGASGLRYIAGGAPEFGTCVKVAKGTGKYKNGACKEEVSGGNDEWTPGVTKTHFTLTAGETVLETAGKAKITCSALSGAGVYTGVKSVGSTTLTLTGCKLSTSKCSSAGAAEGEVVTSALEGVLGWRSHEAESVGLDLSPAGEVGSFMELKCAASTVVVRGSVIVPMDTDSMAEASTLKYDAARGKQKPEAFEGEPKDVLEASIAGAAFEQAGLTATVTQTNEEAIEVNASV